jgi:transitional endoplasmic reticulum ATPase
MLAFRRAFGMMTQRTIRAKSIFDSDQPPSLITIPVGHDEVEQVPWGAVGLAHLPGVTFVLGSSVDPEMGPLFLLSASGPRRWRFHVEGVFNLVEEELRANSMYRGKAFDGQDQAQFLDLSGVDPAKVVYSQEVVTQLEANVWSLIRWPKELERVGVSLKRAVLFEGPYGTGKTLAAYLTAKEAVEHGWTFIYCRPGRDDFQSVMQTARLYQPSVVFFEDVDTIAEAGESRTDDISRLLDVFDGVQAKGTKIVAVLTTNHAERIHRGMVRPGRLDAVIHVGALDSAGFERLVLATVPPEQLADDVDFDMVAESFEGFLPAFAREAIDRAMRYNVARNGGKAGVLETADFVHAAHGLRPQLELMEGASEATSRPTVDLGIRSVVAETLADTAFRYDDDKDAYVVRP